MGEKLIREDLQRAAAHIAEYVQKTDYVTFAEITNQLQEIGIETQGRMCLEIRPNAVLWAGMSQDYVDVMHALQDAQSVHPVPASTLTYMIDGRFLDMPIAKRIPPNGYKKPHWVPVCFRPGRDPKAPERKSREVR